MNKYHLCYNYIMVSCHVAGIHVFEGGREGEREGERGRGEGVGRGRRRGINKIT